MDNYLYRNESGEGERRIKSVIAFETCELGNTDIWEYCLEHYALGETTKMRINGVLEDPYNENNVRLAIDSLIADLTWIFGKEPRYCLWLSDWESVNEFYGSPTTKCLPSDIILSDLGADGVLFAYHDEPNEIDIVEEAMWNKISLRLMHTSKDKPMNVDIIIETNEDMGLSSNDQLRISKIWQHPTEGWIDFCFYGSNRPTDLSEHEELIPQIYQYLEQ